MPNRRNCVATIGCCLPAVPMRIIIIIERDKFYEQVLFLCDLLTRARSGVSGIIINNIDKMVNNMKHIIEIHVSL